MRKIVLLALTVLLVGGIVSLAGADTTKPTVSFSEDILPILQTRCTSCHSPGGEGTQKSGLVLSSYEGLMKGTKFGPVVNPGDPVTSNLMVLLDGRADKSLQMPHGKKRLTSCDRDLIRTWIHEGAQNN